MSKAYFEIRYRKLDARGPSSLHAIYLCRAAEGGLVASTAGRQCHAHARGSFHCRASGRTGGFGAGKCAGRHVQAGDAAARRDERGGHGGVARTQGGSPAVGEPPGSEHLLLCLRHAARMGRGQSDTGGICGQRIRAGAVESSAEAPSGVRLDRRRGRPLAGGNARRCRQLLGEGASELRVDPRTSRRAADGTYGCGARQSCRHGGCHRVSRHAGLRPSRKEG